MPNARKKAAYSKRDMREVGDNPELTKADLWQSRIDETLRKAVKRKASA